MIEQIHTQIWALNDKIQNKEYDNIRGFYLNFDDLTTLEDEHFPFRFNLSPSYKRNAFIFKLNEFEKFLFTFQYVKRSRSALVNLMYIVENGDTDHFEKRFLKNVYTTNNIPLETFISFIDHLIFLPQEDRTDANIRSLFIDLFDQFKKKDVNFDLEWHKDYFKNHPIQKFLDHYQQNDHFSVLFEKSKANLKRLKENPHSLRIKELEAQIEAIQLEIDAEKQKLNQHDDMKENIDIEMARRTLGKFKNEINDLIDSNNLDFKSQKWLQLFKKINHADVVKALDLISK